MNEIEKERECGRVGEREDGREEGGQERERVKESFHA